MDSFKLFSVAEQMSATLTFHHYLPHIAANPFERDTNFAISARQKPGTTVLQLRECHLFGGVVSYVPETAQAATDPSCSARNYAPESGPPLFSVRAAVAQPTRGRIGAPIRLEDMFLEHDAVVKFKIGALKIAAPVTFQTDSHFIETNYAEHVELGDSDAHLVLRYSGRGYQPEYVRLDVPIGLVEMADPSEGERIRQRSQEALMAREMVALQIGASFSGFKTRAKSAASKVKRPSATKMKARAKSFKGRLSRSRSRSKSSSKSSKGSKGSKTSRAKGAFRSARTRLSRSRSPSSGSSGSRTSRARAALSRKFSRSPSSGSSGSFKSRASSARDKVKSKASNTRDKVKSKAVEARDKAKGRFARKPAQSGYKVDKKTGLTGQQTRSRERAAASGTTGRSPSPSQQAGMTRPSSPPPAAPKSGSAGTGRGQSPSEKSGKTRPSAPPPAAPKGGASSRSQSPSEQAGKTRPSAPPPAAPKSGAAGTGTGRPQPPSSPPSAAPKGGATSRSQSPSQQAGMTKPSGPLPQTPQARSQSPSERAGMSKPTRPLPQTPTSTSKPTGTTSTASQGATAAKPSTAAATANAAKSDRRQGAKDAVKSQKERADRAGSQGQGSQRQQAMAAVDKASPGSLGGGGGGGGGMPSIGGGGGGGGGDNMGMPTGDDGSGGDGSGGLPPGQVQPQPQNQTQGTAVPYGQQPTMLYDTPEAAARRAGYVAPVPYAQLPPAYAIPTARPPAVPTLIPARPSSTSTLSPQQLDQVELQLAALAADDAAATPPNIPLTANYWAARKARAEAALKLIDETSGAWPPSGLARLSPPTAAGQTDYWRTVNQYSMQKLAESEPLVARELRTHLVNGYFAHHPRVHQISAAIDRVALSPDAERINCYVRDIGSVISAHN